MSELGTAVKALTIALEAGARSQLSLIDELTQSRVIQQRMANTLIEIHTGQEQLIVQMRQLVERQNDHGHRQSASESKILVLSSKLERHAESTEKRLRELERVSTEYKSASR